jgi:hypothetical protein
MVIVAGNGIRPACESGTLMRDEIVRMLSDESDCDTKKMITKTIDGMLYKHTKECLDIETNPILVAINRIYAHHAIMTSTNVKCQMSNAFFVRHKQFFIEMLN